MQIRAKNRLVEGVKHLVILFFLVITFAPLFVMVFKSFKNIEQNLYQPFLPTWPLLLENYKLAWQYVGGYILNTVVIAAGGTVLTVLISAMAGYAFARYQFPGKGFFYMAIIALMMVPGILTLVPMFLLCDQINLLDSKWAIILPGLRAQIPMAVFLIRGFMEGIPKDLFEAASIDGAGMLRSFTSIALPLVKPILATVAILTILFFWNDIIWPNIAIQTESNYTIAIGLKPFTGEYMTKTTKNYGPAMAGYCIVSIPLLIAFFFASKQFIEGLTSGSVKM